MEMEEEQTKDTSEAPAPDGSEDLPAVTVEGELQAVTAERDKLAAEKAEVYDRLLRKQAEFENFRRRTDRERSDFLQFAGMDLARELLPVLDDFERALKVECSDSNYAKGVELIHQRLSDVLKKMGVEPIQAAGKKFDPNVHEAVVRFPTDEVEDQTVLEEFQKGYNFKGKLLRPAMVKVAVRP
jgi:molecular chaperone GrpE